MYAFDGNVSSGNEHHTKDIPIQLLTLYNCYQRVLKDLLVRMKVIYMVIPYQILIVSIFCVGV